MKKLLAFLLVVLMLTPTVSAYTDQQLNTADALNHLGLFLGNGVDYDLDGKLSRAEGITLLVRMIGKESRAKRLSYTAPFTDVPSWAAGYVNYAWMNKITNGISQTEFDPNTPMTDYMFLTLVLRVLGYKDSGDKAQFQWDNPYALANSVGLIAVAAPDNSFCRGEAITVFWNALMLNGQALAKELIENEVFTAEAFSEAMEIQKNGRDEGAGVPVLPSDPSAPVDPVVPSTPGSDIGGGEDSSGDVGGTPWFPPYNPDPNPPSNPDDLPDLPPSDPNEDSDDPYVPDSGVTLPDQPATPPGGVCTYEEYQNMTDAEQKAYRNSFPSISDYFAWLGAAMEEYENSQNKVEIGGDGSVDLGDYIGGNN